MKPLFILAVMALSATAAAAQTPAQPVATMDLGTGTGRIAVQGPGIGTPVLILIGTRRLATPITLPGMTGSLEVDPAGALLLSGLNLDALGGIARHFMYSNPPTGQILYMQAATVEATSPLDVRLSALASDQFPASDGLYLDHVAEAGTRARWTVCEAVQLIGGGVRLFHNNVGTPGAQPGIGSSTSADGINFSTDPGVRVPPQNPNEIVGNPGPVVLPDGRLRLYYVVFLGSGPAQREFLRSAISTDWLNFTAEPGDRFVPGQSDLGRMGVPDFILLDDGRVRMYYQGALGGANNVRSAISTDGGMSFTQESIDLFPSSGSLQFVDTDVLRLPDGRFYALAMKNSRAFYAFTSRDGLVWTQENGGLPVVKATMLSGPQSQTIADPASILLSDGRIRTYFHDNNASIRSTITTSETGRGPACPAAGVPCGVDLRGAVSPDGSLWLPGGTLLTDAASPAQVRLPDGRILVYHVDGTTTPPHLGVFELFGNQIRDQRRVTVINPPMDDSTFVDPAPVVVGGQAWLYMTIQFGGAPIGGIGRGRLDSTGTQLTYEGVILSAGGTLSDPDLVQDPSSGLLNMLLQSSTVPSRLTSADGGASFTFVGPIIDLQNEGLTRPPLSGSLWRMYTFDPSLQGSSQVMLWTSTDLQNWTALPGWVFSSPLGTAVRDPQVIQQAGAYSMVYESQ